MDNLLHEFLTETNESLDVVDIELVKFEQDPNNAKILDNIFRLVHTVKGTCGFLGLPRLEALAHAAENLMGKYRDGMQVTDSGVTVILHSIDRLKEILAGLEDAQAEPEGSDQDLINHLNSLALEQAVDPFSVPAEMEAAQAKTAQTEGGLAFGPDSREPEARFAAGQMDPELGRALRPGEVSTAELERAFAETEVEPEPADAHSKTPVEPGTPAFKAEGQDNGSKKESSIAAQSIRVDVDTLENLMTMVSELVLTRNQLLEMVRRMDDSEFMVPLQRLSNVTGELQEAVMKTRMQPIGNAWNKLPRIVRDLSQDLNKTVDLEMIGADTELDRQVLDLIKDPLTHMVRNSADHGLESAAERIRAGKPERGKIILRAYHQGGHIVIDISDDGKGLDVERIKQQAIAKGLVSEAKADKLGEQQILRFIFSAGFSTATEVTSVSGRGVGMDVVRTNIELIGGSIDLRSVQGEGTTFTIKIPLTLAIVSALIVESAGERFAIPQLAVVELVRARAGSGHCIEHINDTPVLRLRNRLLPLVFMDQFLGINQSGEINQGAEDNAATDSGESHKTPAVASDSDTNEAFIVVMRVGEQTFGIVVNNVFDTEEIVVKPVASFLRDITIFSGNTILGDGSVIMIMDPNGVAHSIAEEMTETTEESSADTQIVADTDSDMSLLLFRAGSQDRKAVPLSLVTRLEEVDVGDIETSNGLNVIQYRGRLMPIVHVCEGAPSKTEGRQPILVFTDKERSVGLAVDEIIDIVTDKLNIEITPDNSGASSGASSGILGSAIIREQATEILDVGHYLTRVFSNWFRGQESSSTGASRKRVLLVDDSAFFRTMLTPQLAIAGYRVVHASGAQEALELRQAGETFDAIISDIEMAGMNGFAFAQAVKDGGDWSHIPIVALSVHGTAEDMERGRQAGFDNYIAKFDRDGLVQILADIMNQKGEAA